MARKVCEKCQRQMEDTNFYTYRDGTKHKYCKACLTMHIDNFDPQTFLYILQDMDVPWLPWEWNILRDRAYAKSPSKMNGMSVIGKYLSKMKLKQFKPYRWEDTQRLQEQHEKQLVMAQELKKEQQEQAQQIKQQFQNGDISEAQYRTLVSTEFQREYDRARAEKAVVTQDVIGPDNLFNEKDFISQDDLPDIGSQLTLEDKQYLAMKWGRTYKASEWVELQKKYNQMMDSFDIHDADSKNTLIFICKTYLKMNQAIDCGDVEGYQKLSRVYDALRKSAKFTAAQNKEQKNDFINSIGQLVAYCQKNGHKIPRYEINTPHDIIDKIIQDMKDYNRTLIYEDTALARQIQDYIKEARAAAASRKDRAEAKARGLEAPELTDQDLLDFKEFVNKEREDTIIQMEGGNE